MQELKVIGVESGALLVATDAGSEFRLPVTLSLQSQVRAADPDHSTTARKVPPREIQASIRAGRSADEVAEATGVDLDYVRRFEGPVLAERDFVLTSARAVSVSVATDGDISAQISKFGEVIDSRLDAASATGRDWTSYKDPEQGWVVHVTYTASETEREATWRFDPKKQSLAPLGGDAHTLSRQDADHGALVPRLRAVAPHPAADQVGDGARPNESGRFDSGAFEVQGDSVGVPETMVPLDRSKSAATIAAMNRAPEAEPAHNQTADLLEALRRRRGEREAARFDEPNDSRAAHPSTGSLRVIDVPLDDFDGPERTVRPAGGRDDADEAEPRVTTKPLATHPTASRQQAPATPAEPTAAAPQRPTRARKGRASMPSWDEIVFGARSDDDPA